MEYVAALQEVIEDRWHPTGNPGGVIQFAVAENVHTWAELEGPMREVVSRFGFADFVPHYGDCRGAETCREAVLRYLRRYVFVRDGMPIPDSDWLFSADHLLVTNGCGPALEHLTFTLCDPGDAILTPAPIYAGFLMDVGRRAQARLVTVPMDTGLPYGLDLAALDRACDDARTDGRRVRALLLSQPYNPIGVCLSVREVERAVQWCRDKGIHLISDEIYAASVFAPEVRHTSAMAFAAANRQWASEKLHILYGLSKDFGLSGFRVGIIYSSSAQLHEALDRLTYFCGCSSLPQNLLTTLLNDDGFVDGYVERNRYLLRRLYQTVASTADRIGIPYVPADSGFFVWIDLRPWLREPTPAGEQDLWARLVEEARVVLTPGLSCRAAEPGMFRLCFAAVPEGGIEVGMKRIEDFLARQT
jgi:aspartate/methionine/tyrosine aminotransferase